LYANSNDNIGTAVKANNATVTVKTPQPFLFSDGFESGNFNEWNYVNGCPSSDGPQISTAEAHTGTYSANFPAKSLGGFGYLMNYFPEQSSFDFRFYMDLASLTGSRGFNEIAEVLAANGDQIVVYLNLASRQFEVDYYNCNLDSDYTYTSSALTLNANTWFCLELALTPTTFTLYYNGVSLVAGTFPDGPTAGFVLAGFYSYAICSSMPAYYVDDVAMSNSYIEP
jgi:hypothetical protein